MSVYDPTPLAVIPPYHSEDNFAVCREGACGCLIEITTPLLGELPEHYCTPCGLPVFMHDDGKPCHSHDDVSRLDLTEVRMSDCKFGCKIWRCSCGEEMLLHSATYGCRGAA